MSTTATRNHWHRVAAMGCLICQSPAEVAHCHGGSIVERMQEPKAKGFKLPRYDWLILPLCPLHHRDTSPLGLDRNVAAWERKFGTQAMYINSLCERLGVDLWSLANIGRK